MKLSKRSVNIIILICTLTIVFLLPMNTYAKETSEPKNRITVKFLNSVKSWDQLVEKTSKIEEKIILKGKVDSINEAFAKGMISEDDNYNFALIHSINADYNNRNSFPFTNFAEIVSSRSLSSQQVKKVKRIIKILNNSLDSSIPKGVYLKYDTYYDAFNGQSYAVATKDYWKQKKEYFCIGDRITFDGIDLKYYESPNNSGSGKYGVISTDNPYLKNTSMEGKVTYWDGTSDTYPIPYTAYINGYAYLDKSGNVLESHLIPYTEISTTDKVEIQKRSSYNNTLMLHVSTKDSSLGWIDSKYISKIRSEVTCFTTKP